MSKIRIALLGTAHPHAIGFWRAFKDFPEEMEFIGYADVPPYDDQEAEAKARENLGQAAMDTVPHFENYKDLLALKPDLALISTDNATHADISCEAMELGIHVMVEKPMAISYADAVRMANCSEKNNVMMAVNWPIAWFPSFNKAKELVDAGKVGKVMRVTYRSPATWGPYSYGPDGVLPPKEFLGTTWWYRRANGGGSLLDYACYGAALATWFFGKQAEKVSGIRKNFSMQEFDIEDYSAMILDFGDGVGLLEGSWTTYNCGEVPSGPVIHGTEGTIVCDRHSSLLKLYTGKSHGHCAPTEVIDCSGPRPDLNLARNVLDHLTKGTPLHPLLDARRNAAVMAALDAGRTSADTGVTVNTSEL